MRLALIGTGNMARTHAEAFARIPGVQLTAAVDIDLARAQAFAARHGIPRAFASELDLLAEDGGCDAVSIVAPDALHARLSITALQAGKHVLCEKPLALDHRGAQRMVAAAQSAGKINLVNLSYRNWAALQAVAARVRAGDIGEVRHVEASYLQSWLTSKIWGDWRTTDTWLWRLSTRHGSRGVLGDIGVHIVDFATYPAGSLAQVYCRLKTFPKAPGDRVGDYVLDANDSAALTVEFANGALGTIHTTRWSTGHANRLYLKISGTHGAFEIDSDHGVDRYRACLGADIDRAAWSEVAAPPVPTIYERFIASIRSGVNDQPDFARGAEVQQVLDACVRSDAKGAPVKL